MAKQITMTFLCVLSSSTYDLSPGLSVFLWGFPYLVVVVLCMSQSLPASLVLGIKSQQEINVNGFTKWYFQSWLLWIKDDNKFHKGTLIAHA